LLYIIVGAVRAVIGGRPNRVASALETYDGKQDSCDVSFTPDLQLIHIRLVNKLGKQK